MRQLLSPVPVYGFLVGLSFGVGLALADGGTTTTYVPYRVTSLADSGHGSLRDCVAVSGRVCLFEVSGRIRLTDALRFRAPNIFVAGQTAPDPGILLTNAGVSVEAAGVTLQHLEIRAGDGPSRQRPADRDSVKVLAPASNVFLDHLSVSWGLDENISTYGAVAEQPRAGCCTRGGRRLVAGPWTQAAGSISGTRACPV